eukprot:5179607-Prymnesium_polylepis.1
MAATDSRRACTGTGTSTHTISAQSAPTTSIANVRRLNILSSARFASWPPAVHVHAIHNELTSELLRDNL